MKISVAVAVYYNYEVEIPDNTSREAIPLKCDIEDPVYKDIAKILTNEKLNFDAEITSIIKEDTDEEIILYAI